ncbi:MAG: glycoside hydrolase family 140 protein, partial [candidate division KSB1 bacterium]|nr:glycoside hydrolase family 140 protein [candidate division KSB1 bacterium]
EADLYLQNRAAKGFTVIQAVVLAELDGLHTPNAYGHLPLIDDDPLKPNPRYFQHVDYIVDKAQKLGLFIGMLPTWGDKWNKQWGQGPEIFTPENAFAYGKFLGRRYKGKNIIWILGGDRRPDNETHKEIIRAMARGIKEGCAGTQLITLHPMGGYSSSEWFHSEEWLDFNMFQSGHGEWNNPNYLKTAHDYRLEPTKPVLDGEPNYEDHPVGWNKDNGWFDEFDSRRAGYWSMLEGACGHTYGNHNIWQMWLPGRSPISQARTPWTQALDYPGAFQAGYMRAFFESRPWQLLQPASHLLLDAPSEPEKICRAALARDGSFLVVYTPYGSTFTLDLEPMKGSQVVGWWYSPAIGKSIYIGKFEKNSRMTFDPPSDEKRGNDWVLLLDDAARNFARPGKK